MSLSFLLLSTRYEITINISGVITWKSLGIKKGPSPPLGLYRMNSAYLIIAVKANARLSRTNPATGITIMGIRGFVLFSVNTIIASFQRIDNKGNQMNF